MKTLSKGTLKNVSLGGKKVMGENKYEFSEFTTKPLHIGNIPGNLMRNFMMICEAKNITMEKAIIKLMDDFVNHS